jgi:hypothetical protein
MKPRTIILIGVAVIIIICAGVYFYFAVVSGGVSIPVGGGATSGAAGGQEATLPLSQALTNTPTTTVLTIGTPGGSVQVNNFYLTNPLVTDGGETVILASTTNYLITYDTTDSSFWIGIDPSQFTALRPVAEQSLLSTLGVSSTVACKLNISEGAFYAAGSSLNGQSFSPIFCGGLNSVQ